MDEKKMIDLLGLIQPRLLEDHIAEQDYQTAKRCIRKLKPAHRWPWITCLAAGGALVAAGGAILARYLIILRRVSRRTA